MTMLEKLLVHPQTHEQLAIYVSNPVHAVMLLGPIGSGKGTLAKRMVVAVLEAQTASAENDPHIKHVEADEKGTISIDVVRDLQRFVRLKTTGTRTIRRALIIEHADGMTTEAQNAFLKLLEEPPADTIIIMTVDNAHSLLPTIRSRAQSITIHTPAKDQITQFFAEKYDEKLLTQSYFLSGGLPGLMSALLEGDQSHPLMASVAQAKAVLQQSPFERLAQLDVLAKQKETALRVCEALNRIAQAGLNQAAAKNDTTRLSQWHKILKASSTARDNLSQSANTKLTLTHLMLQL